MKSSNHHFVPISLKHLNFYCKEFFDTVCRKTKPNHWIGNQLTSDGHGKYIWWAPRECLLTIYMDKPVGPRFEQMLRKSKFSTGQFRSEIAFTISTNQFHLPKNNRRGLKPRKNNLLILSCWNWYQRWLWRNGGRISVCNVPFAKIGLSFQMFRCSRKFLRRTTQKVVFHLLS